MLSQRKMVYSLFIFLNNTLTYHHKAFDERSVLNVANLCMAMSRKHVTNQK